MLQCLQRVVLGVVVVASNSCTSATGIDDARPRAHVAWLEARWQVGGIEFRAAGNAGCEGLARIDVDVREDTTISVAEVLVDARASGPHPNVDCQGFGAFDTTVRVSLSGTIPPALTYIASRASLFIVASGSSLGASRFVGGRIVVDTVLNGCPVLTPLILDPIYPLITYAFDPGPAVTLSHGTVAFVRGFVPDTPTTGCGGAPRMELQFVELQ
jgi:hypothetical protein